MTKKTLNDAMAHIQAQLPTDPGSQPFRDLDPSTTYDPASSLPAVDDAMNLSDIADRLTREVMANDAWPIVTISADPETNTVQIGVPDVNDPAALALKQQYGDAVELVQQNPYVDLTGTPTASAPAAADAKKHKNP